MEYLAHIRKKDKKKQSLFEHLAGVADKSAKFASKIGLAKPGRLIGLLHDLGKYSGEFQRYIKSEEGMLTPDEDDYMDAQGAKGKIDHSTAGAQFVFKGLHAIGNEAGLIAQILSLCIASHHSRSGLIDCLTPDAKDVFTIRMNKPDDRTHFHEVRQKADKEILDKSRELLLSQDLTDRLIGTLKKIHVPEEKSAICTHFKQGLLIRFLFSCLIDGDRLDAADFEEPHLAALRNNGQYRSWDELIFRLEKRLSDFKQLREVDKLRCQVSESCLAFATRPRGIYLLTVPTGGGKTLASLRFALHHAKEHKLDRVIYVIPFTTIIDQNAEEVRRFLEDRDPDGFYLNRVVLEHHSNLTPDEETWQQKILAEDWDAPLVFTTNVQLLETLYGGGTRNARRMHQLAKSVVIFDEIQTLPVRSVHMFNNAINFLVRNCGATVVLCTATQPLLNHVDEKLGVLDIAPEQEIMPNAGQLFADLKRVEILDNRKSGGWTSNEVADLATNELGRNGSVLLIVNTKKAAHELYEKCRQQTHAKVYHLSTSMCPAHRINVLIEVRSCLDPENPKPVLCVSTQLIEAGVDIDFGCVIRSIAGLDSIAQAAGRCNRNGIRPVGHVYVVNPDFENLDKLKDLRIGKEKAERLLDEYRSIPASFDHDLLGPKAIGRYFEYYFYERAEEMKYPVGNNSVVGRNDSLLWLLSTNSTAVDDYCRANNSAPPIYFRQSFMTAAKVFQAIDSPTQGVIVPYKEGRRIISELCSAYRVEKQYKLLRDAQRYSVNVFSYEWEKLADMGAIHEVQKNAGIYYLKEEHYDQHFGLSMTPVNTSSILLA